MNLSFHSRFARTFALTALSCVIAANGASTIFTNSYARASGDGIQGGYISDDTVSKYNAHAYIWHGDNASNVDLNPANADYSKVLGISRNGQYQTGDARINGTYYGAIWQGSAASATLYTPPAWANASIIEGITNDGLHASGYSTKNNVWDAELWTPGQSGQVSINPDTATSSYAYKVVDANQGKDMEIAGWAQFGDQHAYLWRFNSDGSNTSVDLNPDGFQYSAAWDVQPSSTLTPDGGVAVGNAFDGSNLHAMEWKGSANNYTDLTPYGLGFTDAEAQGINTAGEVVGDAYDSYRFDAMVWDTSGHATDLQQFLPANYYSSTAYSIDDAGNVLGVANYDFGNYEYSGAYAVLWTPNTAARRFGQSTVTYTAHFLYPVPEPTSMVALGLGVAAAIRRRRKAQG
ncbi:MAG: PEP-CTERM sorting domain-containing protein [Armatimonadetes bacterium]|nr:PEP-CTERM sorting domain-containing protein [Armatimonadota bacterium]